MPHVAQCIIVLAFAATLLRLAKQLPLQNVLAAAGTILCLSILLEILNQKTGFPFGRFAYTANFGARLLNVLPWPVPLLWAIILLNARAAAKVLFKRRKRTPNQGLRVLAISALLSAFAFVCLEPIGYEFRWWVWKSAWIHAALAKFVGTGLLSLFILAATFPWLIDKKSIVPPGNATGESAGL